MFYCNWESHRLTKDFVTSLSLTYFKNIEEENEHKSLGRNSFLITDYKPIGVCRMKWIHLVHLFNRVCSFGSPLCFFFVSPVSFSSSSTIHLFLATKPTSPSSCPNPRWAQVFTTMVYRSFTHCFKWYIWEVSNDSFSTDSWSTGRLKCWIRCRRTTPTRSGWCLWDLGR